jgi:hypothetical protein
MVSGNSGERLCLVDPSILSFGQIEIFGHEIVPHNEFSALYSKRTPFGSAVWKTKQYVLADLF